MLVLMPGTALAQATVPESALSGPTFSLSPNQPAEPGQPAPQPGQPAPQSAWPNGAELGKSGVQAPPSFGPPHVAPGTPGALIPKRPMGTVAATGDPIMRAYVQSLQQQLPAHGYRPGPVSGRLDPATEQAIVAYQRDAGIAPDAHSAYALQQTIDSVNFARPPIKAGAVHAAAGGKIAYVQQRLAAKGYDAGPADGKLGARTVTAIKDFQGDQGLPRDGQLSPQLLDLLGRT